jgi:hypothetical protein
VEEEREKEREKEIQRVGMTNSRRRGGCSGVPLETARVGGE